MWVDFRGILDAPMRKAGFDYFENSRRATYAQRAYAIANPKGWAGYGENVWGLTASDGAADVEAVFAGEKRRFRTYFARGTDASDDGTIAPTAAAASIAFAPEIAIPAVEEMHRRYGQYIYGEYGFYDAFNPTFDFDVPLRHGRRIPGFGWVAGDYLGIDQGPILAMIENRRSAGLLVDHHMGGDHVHAAGDRPGVQVMDLADTRGLEDVPSHLIHVDALRCRLEQDIDRFAQQPPCPRQDQQPDARRCHGIGGHPARHTDRDRGDDHRD